MKMIHILAALAAMPIMAQDPQTPPANNDNTAPSAAEQCPKCGNAAVAPCPQAAIAAAISFQRGFQMGFDAGLDQAARMQQRCSACTCPKGGKGNPHGRPMPPRPTAPAPAPQQPAE